MATAARRDPESWKRGGVLKGAGIPAPSGRYAVGCVDLMHQVGSHAPLPCLSVAVQQSAPCLVVQLYYKSHKKKTVQEMYINVGMVNREKRPKQERHTLFLFFFLLMFPVHSTSPDSA